MTPQILSSQAHEALRQGDLSSAARSLARLVELTPRDHRAWYALAEVMVQIGQVESSVEAARRAVSLDRRNADYHNALGVALSESGAYAEALESFRRAVKLKPSLSRAHFNLGKALGKLRRLDEAIDAYRRAERIAPADADIRFNLARALWLRGDIGEAVRSYERLATQRPDDPRVASDLANAISSLGGPEEACRHYRAALQRFPQDLELHWAYAAELLGIQRWQEGWPEYLWRPGRAAHRLPRPGTAFDSPKPHEVSGRTILLEPEQGLGDTLFFCRFIDELRGLGARALLRCPPQLGSLIEALELAEGPVAADMTLALDDLPAVLRTRQVPAPLPLKVDAGRAAHWKRKLAQLGPPPYLAFTWRAGTDMSTIPEFGRNWEYLSKEIDVMVLGHAVREVPGTLICVQRRARNDEMAAFSSAANRVVHDCADVNDDLAEMAALLAALDGYVCVSNTNTHIAAGIGLAAHVLVPHPAEWRWLSSGDASPWFPGARVYRQAPDRSWEAAMRRLAEDLSGPA